MSVSAASFRMIPGCKLIVITGMSGCGKSTVGPKLAEHLGAGYLDEDKFYIPKDEMPKVDYKGRKVTLWDDEKCINFPALKEAICKKSVERKFVVLTGFYLPPGFLDEFPIEAYVILNIDEETSLERRQKSKTIMAASGVFDLEKDKWMIKNYVIPFNQKGLRKVRSATHFPVHEINGLGTKEEVWSRVEEKFSRLK